MNRGSRALPGPPRRRISVVVLFVGVLVALTTLVLGASTALAYRAESRQRLGFLEQDLATTAEQLATSLALPVWNFDQSQADQIIDSIMKDPVVVEVAMTTGFGQPDMTVRWRGPDGVARPAARPAFPLGSPAPAHLLVAERPVLYAGKTLGAIRVVYTTRYLESQRHDLLKHSVESMLALDLLLIAGVSLLLWGSVLHPLREIRHLAEVVSSGATDRFPERGSRYFGELDSLQDSLLRTLGLLRERYGDLQLSEERFRVLIESTSDMIWSVDREFRLQSYNSSFAAYIRNTYHAEPFAGATAEMALPPDRAALWLPLFRRAFAEGPYVQELTLPDGRILEMVFHPLVRDGEVVGASVFGKDITQRHKADAELRMHRHHLEELVALRTAELEAARTAAESANASKSAFLANMSHEIRTPMNAVIGLTHLALQTELTDQQRNYLEKARTASENLLGIINDILDFSKIEAGKLQMGAEAFQLEEVLERTLRLAGARTGERRLETRLELAPEVPTALVGDPLRLGQVLTNLLSNALKFTESGEVVLSVRRLRPLDGRVVLQFSVRDTGIGIAPEQLQRLFLPFSQADGSITRTYGGTGLGLAICRHLVHLMEGEIRVASEPGQGSEFVFTAVFGLGSAVAAGTQPARRPGPSPEQLRRLQGAQVLLVEDNEFNQLVATDLLGILGVRATLARNGQEALELIRGQRFQAVLMDLQMPVLDGYETTLRIRADPALAGLPIVAMTAHAMVRERERCRALGMDDYLTKPINPELLAGTLARWIGGDRPGTGAAGWTPEPEAPAGEPAPVISWAAGAGNFQGHPALYEKTLLKFLDLQRTRPGHIQALLDQGELESAGREAHSMIAGAGMIGAGRLALSARELQDALGAGPAGRVAPALARYEADLALVLEQLEARFDKA